MKTVTPCSAGKARTSSRISPNACGIETVGRLVEDEELRFPQQCQREAQPLMHPERVAAHQASVVR